MELKAYFSGIHRVIIDHLGKAQTEIVAAVAWFTDRDIFEALCKKAQSGIKVSIALIGDDINQGPGGLNFHRLRNLGGQVIFLSPGSRHDPTMHHKFCVIDNATVITGSYNWSHKARSNDENVTVVSDAETFASTFICVFDDLLARSSHASEITVIDSEAIRRRLELIRSMVLLGETGEIAPHIRKLRPATEKTGLGRLINALEAGQFNAALELIDAYLSRATALILADDAEISRLRFELSILEVRLQSLSDEKTELERRLMTFNRRHSEVLGDVIQRLLRARSELARLTALQLTRAAGQDAADAARDAEETYAEYTRQHEALQDEDPLPSLDDNEERELKALYRKACSLCHPDKFPEDFKEAAHRAFTELQAAYKSNDMSKVREIHASLATGGLPDIRSATLGRVDALRATIAELEFAIARTLIELKALQGSDACRLLDAAGASEANWQKYLARQLGILEQEMARVEAQVLAKREEVETAGQRVNER